MKTEEITFRKSEIIAKLENIKARSAWKNGVKDCAIDLIDRMENETFSGSIEALKNELLNGANSWQHYAWSGCGMIYNGEIAVTFCTPSELKKTCNGSRRPNASEDWLDVYARGLYQAWDLIKSVVL